MIVWNSDENTGLEGSAGQQKMSKQKVPVKISAAMQLLIEVMAERSEGVATNLTDKDFIEMLMLICKR